MVDPNYYSSINTRINAMLTVANAKITALDNVVAVLKARGVNTEKLELQCGKIHSLMATLEAVSEVDAS